MSQRWLGPSSSVPAKRSTRRAAIGAYLAAFVASSVRCNVEARSTNPPDQHQRNDSSNSQARPNIILVVTDDMRADDLVAMPAVQSLLAAEGASFTNFVVAAPSCGPARTSILRGQYPHNHGVLRGKGDFGGFTEFQALDLEQSTIATWLHDAGYRTGLIGKYLNGYRPLPYGGKQAPVPPGWDSWSAIVRSDYTHSMLNETGQLFRYAQDHYSTDLLAAQAKAFVMGAAGSDQPFFLYLAPQAPHAPAVPAPRHISAFPDVKAPRSPSFNEDDVYDKPSWIQGALPMSDEGIVDINAVHASRWRSLLAVDEMVAALISTLSETGALESTYFVFTSDNGYHLGEHRVAMKKGTPYEESIRVPLIIRGPGIPTGTTIDAVVSQIDLAPTLAGWANMSVPAFVDGRSLAPLVSGSEPSTTWRQAVLSEHYVDRPKRSPLQPSFAALRAADLNFVEYTGGERELYDLATDPYQLENRAAAADPSVIQALSSQLDALRHCKAATCRSAEDRPLPAVRIENAALNR